MTEPMLVVKNLCLDILKDGKPLPILRDVSFEIHEGENWGIAGESGVTLAVETAGSPLICMGNEDRITQVLVILMDNALSFTPAGGTVTVYARDAGRCVAVGVRDTGCGIEPKDLPLIWERFYKADKSRMRTTGTGLGLSIAKLVCELMNGRITAASEPGQGATFEFSLAICKDYPA